jgi:hypothetical protein
MVTQQYVTTQQSCNAYNGNESNKPLHSNGYVLIDAHVGGSNSHIRIKEAPNKVREFD